MPWLALFLACACALRSFGAPEAEPLPRHESNVSIRNEVQLALDKGLAHLQSTQRADGTWGKIGTTGFALMALQRDPRGRGESATGAFGDTLEKGCAGLRQILAATDDLQKMADFAWNVPPALLALNGNHDPRNAEVWARGRRAIGVAPPPEEPETFALFLALDPNGRSSGRMPSAATGSALAAWIWHVVERAAKPNQCLVPKQFRLIDGATAWLREHYTLERNPGGEGVHRYYFWLSSILDEKIDGYLKPDLHLADGRVVDIPRQLAEKLINEQNADGSWSGVGDHWTEKDADLVTATSLLTLERVYGQL